MVFLVVSTARRLTNVSCSLLNAVPERLDALLDRRVVVGDGERDGVAGAAIVAFSVGVSPSTAPVIVFVEGKCRFPR